MEIKKILQALLLKEDEAERMDLPPKTFEDDPMNFILKKYSNLHEILVELMGDNFKEYLMGIYVIADKPTCFKVVLHNNQYFFLTFMGEAYQATIAGKNYFLLSVGEKQRAMIAITRLLRWGSPLKTKGAEGAEQEASAEDTTTDTGETALEEPSSEETGEGGEGETLEESFKSSKKVLKILLEAVTEGSTEAEKVLEILINIKPNIKSENDVSKFLKLSDNDNAKFLVEYNKKFIKSLSPEKLYYKALTTVPSVSNAENLGGDNYETTDKWKTYGGLKSTRSKTDVASDQINFSVKNGETKVRVLDASAPQIKALINCTIDKLKYQDKIKKELQKSISKLEKLYKSEDASLARLYKGEKYGLGDLRKLSSPKIKSMITNFDKNTKELNTVVDNIFKTAMKDPKFTTTFIYESLSGEEMFGKKSKGHADKILTYSLDFSIVKIHEINEVSKKIASSYTIPKFGTKSSGTRIAKTIQQFYQEPEMKESESLNELMNEYDKILIIEDKLVKDKLLLEANVFNKAIKYVKEKGSEILNKIFDFFNRIINKIKELVNTSINKTLEFLGIELEVDSYDLDASIKYNNL